MREGPWEEGGYSPHTKGQTPRAWKKARSVGKGMRERRELDYCSLTRALRLRALQAVAAGGGEAALGEAALAAGEHSSGGHNTRRGLLPKPGVQVLNFLLL